MNERIKELIDMCTDQNMTKPWPLIDAEKLAKLIVKNCAYIADHNWSLGPPTGSIMKEYFGVKDD